jgi:GH15 family glucan-1,4-alpha-glucosidase
MARSAFLSNGRLGVGLDEKGFVNDFYYPYVGLDNMTSARFIHHKIGVWVDGIFSWLDSYDWHVSAGLDEHSMMSRVHYHSDRFGLSLNFRDFVDVTYDFFGRVVIVENHLEARRDVRLFFGQVFQISDAGRVDTALYHPSLHPYILTYHGNLSFVAGLRTQDGDSFDQFAVGNYGIEGKAGTYLDAEDGELSGNLVEHGGVDSIIRTSFEVHAKGSYHVDYWVAASNRNYSHATHIHRHLSANGLYYYLNATSNHWKQWLAKSDEYLTKVDVKYRSLATKSLLTIKAHCDERGGIIASADSSIYNYGRDYYNYVWPRDAFYALSPLLEMGYLDETKMFLDMMMRVRSPRGYAHHKYLPDYSMGSTWHPMMQGDSPELNIQEDETASVVMLAQIH